MTRTARYELARPVRVAHAQMLQLPVQPVGQRLEGIEPAEGGLRFVNAAWLEVLLTVGWDDSNDVGHRFAHTPVPDQHPLHSEAIEARVVNALSDGTQLLRGNTIFGPDGVDSITLEVWQDSGTTLSVRRAALEVRRLS